MQFFTGIDVGGSKTHALIINELGEMLGSGNAGPGNHEAVGYEGLQAAIQQAFGQALSQANLSAGRINGAGFGVAGYDWPSEKSDTLQVINTLGMHCPVALVNDAVLGLFAGSPHGWGVNLIAGTSNNCYGRDRQGREGRVTGAGMLFGEFGGALEIVVKAIQAVNYEWIQRGPKTLITEHLMALTGRSNLPQLMEDLAMQRIQLNPAWALEVFAAAMEGDAVAGEILGWAADELGELACAVIRQLQFENQPFDLVLSGSVFQKATTFIEPVRQKVLGLANMASLILLDAPPVSGAVLLGMSAAGLSHEQMYPLVKQATVNLEI